MTLSAMVARPTGRNWVRADRFGGRCKAFLCRGSTHQARAGQTVASHSGSRHNQVRLGQGLVDAGSRIGVAKSLSPTEQEFGEDSRIPVPLPFSKLCSTKPLPQSSHRSALLAGHARLDDSLSGRAMLERLSRAERYRKEANRYADLAKDTTQPGFLTDLFRRTAVRYVLMAEDLERSPERRRVDQDGLSTSLKARADVFLMELQNGAAEARSWRKMTRQGPPLPRATIERARLRANRDVQCFRPAGR